MSVHDLLYMGWVNLSRRRSRTVLTVLAMAIGVMCVVVLFSVGLGYEQAYRESLEAMGSLSKIDVLPPQNIGGKTALLNDTAVKALKGLDRVEAVTPVRRATAFLKSGAYINAVNLYGIDLSCAEDFLLVPEKGIAPGKGQRLRPELLVTEDLAEGFADPGRDWTFAKDQDGKALIDPLKSRIKLTFDYSNIAGRQKADVDGRALPGGAEYSLNITGVCSTVSNNYASAAFLDIERLQEWLDANKAFVPQKSEEELAIEKRTGTNYELVWVKVKNIEDVQKVAEIIRDAGLATYSLNDMLETVRRQSRQIQGMLGALGAVALVVAALSVANTMMMSINERTREVGVLKVLGTELTDIAKMFLAEALIVGIIGGAAGLCLSFFVKALLPIIFAGMDFRSVIPLWLALFGVVFSGAVAVVSALVPAYRAMKISPNAALRAE